MNGLRSPSHRYVATLLWQAQGKCCGICGRSMVPASYNHPLWGWTIEHVWPRGRYAYQGEGNRFISHSVCNHGKSDRDPTGCELIVLALVNAVLELELTRRLTAWRDEATGPTAMQLAFAKAGNPIINAEDALWG